MARDLGITLRVVAITDLRLGSLVQADGIDLAAVLALGPGDGDFSQFDGGSSELRNEWVIRSSPADIIVEATFTNPIDGEPGVSHVRWAIEAGKDVCTTNKGPVALHGNALKALARRNRVNFEFEGTVLSDTPIIRLARRMFHGLTLNGFEGVLNGTSNYVLGRLEAGLDLDAAIVEAQELGFAEADPTADIEGSDVQLKVVILANELLQGKLTTADVPREGITALTAQDFQDAAEKGLHWRLIGSAARRPDGSIDARVAPVALPTTHPLSGLSGSTNAVAFHTDLLGTVAISGPGAGRIETAYALLSDIIAIHEDRENRTSSAPALEGVTIV